MEGKYHYFIPLILQKIGYVFFWILFKIFVSIKILGRENLKNLSGPLIIAANHTHEIDPAVFPLLFPFFSKHFPLYFVSNQKSKYGYDDFGWRSFFYGGRLFNFLGAYQVFSGTHDYGQSLKTHINLLKQGRTVCIFPEGQRTRTGALGPAHGGVAYLSYITGAPVVPIAINTFFNMTWRDFFMRRRKVEITVGNPIRPQEIMQLDRAHIIEDFKNGAQSVLKKSEEMLY